MKRIILIALVLATIGSATPARADGFAIGLFLGQPTGLDIKIGLQRRSALDIVIGKSDFDDNGLSYGHLTYLALLGVGRGESVNVPIRLGIGAAVLGALDDNTFVAVRVPLQIGLRFRRTPIEVYGEISALVYFGDFGEDNVDTGVDGGMGLRFYF